MGICRFKKYNSTYHDNPEAEGDAYDLTYDLKRGNVVVFIETNCKRSSKALDILKSVNIKPVILDVSLLGQQKAIKNSLKAISGSSSSFPYVFVVRNYYGSLSEVEKGVSNHTIQKLINSSLERVGKTLAS